MTGYVPAPDRLVSVYNPSLGLLAATQVGSRCIDQHGNLWLYTLNNLRCINQAGTILQTYVVETVLDPQIISWAAAYSGPFGLGYHGTTSFSQSFGVLRDGEAAYLVYRTVFYQGGVDIREVVSVWLTSEDGTLALQGVVWGAQNNGFLDSSKVTFFGLANAQTFNDPLMVWVTSRAIGGRTYAKAYPSINTIVGAADPTSTQAYPIVDSFYGEERFNLGSANFNSLGSSAGGSVPTFFMPAAEGATNAFIYINAASMAHNHAIYPGTASCAWVETDLYPTYPNGCMVKVPLGVVPTQMLGSLGYIETTVAPDAAPGVFTNGTPYDAFTDIWTNYDGSGSHGSNDYFPVPAILGPAGGGKWLVGWYRPTFIDDGYTADGLWTVKVKVRLQHYDPETEVFTDVGSAQGGVAYIADIGAPQPYGVNFVDIAEFVMWLQHGSLMIWNMDEGSATGSGRYYTWMGTLQGIVGQVTVNVRIGKP